MNFSCKSSPPLFVNGNLYTLKSAKQYHRIIKRREQRARLAIQTVDSVFQLFNDRLINMRADISML
jgi:hypothetical protein